MMAALIWRSRIVFISTSTCRGHGLRTKKGGQIDGSVPCLQTGVKIKGDSSLQIPDSLPTLIDRQILTLAASLKQAGCGAHRWRYAREQDQAEGIMTGWKKEKHSQSGRSAPLACLGELCDPAEFAFDYLPGWRQRHRRNEHNLGWPFVRRQMLRRMLCQFFLRNGYGWQELQEAHDFPSVFRSLIRPSNHRRAHDGRMCVQHGLNFRWVNVLSKPDDQFLRTANDEKISLLETSEVPRVEPSLRVEGRRRPLRSPIVPLHHIRTAHPKFADLPVNHRLAIGPHQLNLHAR